ncbi:HEAT repeat domain-containing protein [Thermogemmatispora sp.]|uniref:HEAT repeat domain-containing protein n=1 Tax=Thermogemmatispora sp. TaxID=1968838 RepID=UPI001D747C41|nr:HEAT repeat domain-containing protein [Thermogemmatispora sp.]MBX5450280.1 HEAT repeat domain-containing protein [Thermogemmatispora sp.]
MRTRRLCLLARMSATVPALAICGWTLVALPGFFFEWPERQANARLIPGLITLGLLTASPATGASPWWENTPIVVALISLTGAVLAAAIPAAVNLYLGRLRTSQSEEEAIAWRQRLSSRCLRQALEQYRAGLRSDPRLTHLQILDMNLPINLLDLYIRVRLHEETRPGYHLDEERYGRLLSGDLSDLCRNSHRYGDKQASSTLDPDEAVRRYRRSVVLGDPGAGKTTLLKYLALRSLSGQLEGLPDLPIFVELNALVSASSTPHNSDIIQFAARTWEERYRIPRSIALALMGVRLQEGKALLLLDALDETLTGPSKEEAESTYRAVVMMIVELATRYPQVPIVVTARKAGYHQRSRLTGFRELEVLDFRPEDIRQFIRRWLALTGSHLRPEAANDLIYRLERSPRVQALAGNPLLLSLIVLLYEEQLDLPDRRVELYRRCVETLLTRWDSSRDIRRHSQFLPEHKLQLLEAIAWHFHCRGQRYFPEDELLQEIARFLPTIGLNAEQSQAIFSEIIGQHTLLKEQARGWYGFLHLTLQEYLTALYAVEHGKLLELIKHRGNPWWEEVILLYAGRVSDISPLLQHLLGSGGRRRSSDDLFHTNLLLAGRCLAMRPAMRESGLRQEVISRLFALLTATPYPLDRRNSAEVLAEIGGEWVNMGLLHLLADESVDVLVRHAIADALGRLGERSLALPLVHLLIDEQIDASVRYAIANALGRMGERTIVPHLLRLLADEGIDPSVRYASAHALGYLGERSIAPELLRLLTDEQVDPSVRDAIGATLGQLGERSVAPQLLGLLADERLPLSLRHTLVAALGQLGERSVAPQLLRLLANERFPLPLRHAIAASLARLGERGLIPQLLSLLENEYIDRSVRHAIAVALGYLGERTVIPLLLELLANEEVELPVREAIAGALGHLGERWVVPHLLTLLADRRRGSWMREAIARTLGNLGERSVGPSLLALLSDEEVELPVRCTIAHTLGQLGERSIVPELLRLLSREEEDKYLRRALAEALGQLAQDQETLQTLTGLLQDVEIADAVYEALWKISRRLGVRLVPGQGCVRIEAIP